jgi:hypothetical protein
LPDQPRPGPSQTEREGGAAEAPPEEEGRLNKGDTVKIGVDLDTLQAILKESKNWNERIIEVCLSEISPILTVENTVLNLACARNVLEICEHCLQF